MAWNFPTLTKSEMLLSEKEIFGKELMSKKPSILREMATQFIVLPGMPKMVYQLETQIINK